MQQLQDNPVLLLVFGLAALFFGGLSLYVFLRTKKLRNEGVVSRGTVTHIFLQQVSSRDSKGRHQTSLHYKMRYRFANRAGNIFTEETPITRAEYYSMGGSGTKVSQMVTAASMVGGALGVSLPSGREEHEVNHPIEIMYLESDPSLNMPKNKLNGARYWVPLIFIFVFAGAAVFIFSSWANTAK